MYKIKIKEGHDVEEVLEKTLRAYRGEVGDDGPLRDPYLRHLHREAKKIYRAVMDAMIEDILDVLDGTDKKSVDTEFLENSFDGAELIKAKPGLVKVSIMETRGGKTFRSHRWMKANAAADIVKKELRDMGVQRPDQVQFKNILSGKAESLKSVISKHKTNGKGKTIQEFIKEKYTVLREEKQIIRVKLIDDMKRKPFVGKEKAVARAGNIISDTAVYRVHNSDFDLWTEDPKSKMQVRLYDKLLNEVKKKIGDSVAIPRIVVLDFKRHGKAGALGGYFRENNTIFLNSEYRTRDAIRRATSKNPGYYARNDEYAVMLHELGHKFHYDTIEAIAKKRNISYNNAKELLEEPIRKYIKQRELGEPGYLEKQLSKYARESLCSAESTVRGTGVNEVIAEFFTVLEKDSELTRYINSHIEITEGGPE